jgi:hypothetical protein
MEVFGKRIKGTIGIGPVTVLDYLEGICDEISRNGFSKILIINGHGPNALIMDMPAHIFIPAQGNKLFCGRFIILSKPFFLLWAALTGVIRPLLAVIIQYNVRLLPRRSDSFHLS